MDLKKKVTVEPWIERDRLMWACPTPKNKITSEREKKKKKKQSIFTVYKHTMSSAL